MLSSAKPRSRSAFVENRIIAGGPTTTATAFFRSLISKSGIYAVTSPIKHVSSHRLSSAVNVTAMFSRHLVKSLRNRTSFGVLNPAMSLTFRASDGVPGKNARRPPVPEIYRCHRR